MRFFLAFSLLILTPNLQAQNITNSTSTKQNLRQPSDYPQNLIPILKSWQSWMVYTGTVSGFGLILTGLYKLSNLRRSHEFKDKKNILRTDKLYAGTYAFRYLTFGALTILTTAFGSLFFNN